MTPVQQKYSISDQKLLALVTTLAKWSYVFRPSSSYSLTVTSKPLRGLTARWLDFLPEFPDLTIRYLQAVLSVRWPMRCLVFFVIALHQHPSRLVHLCFLSRSPWPRLY